MGCMENRSQSLNSPNDLSRNGYVYSNEQHATYLAMTQSGGMWSEGWRFSYKIIVGLYRTIGNWMIQ